MMIDMGEGGNLNVLHHWHHWSGNGLDDGCNHWRNDGLLVDLCVALVGDSMGQSLDHGDSWSHIGLMVHSSGSGGNKGGLHHRHNWSHMLHDRHNWSHMMHNWSHNWCDGLHDGHNGLDMLDNGCDDSLIMELGEALVGCGQWCRVHHLGNHWSGGSNHMMLLHKTGSSCGNGGQGTDSELEKKNEM